MNAGRGVWAIGAMKRVQVYGFPNRDIADSSGSDDCTGSGDTGMGVSEN